MPRIFGFSERITASSRNLPALLADGVFYEVKGSRLELSGADNVRFTVFLERFTKSLEIEDEALARDSLEKLVSLVCGLASPALTLKPLDIESLYSLVERFLNSDAKAMQERPQNASESDTEADIGLAVAQYARAYGIDPWSVWENVPLWMLDAGLGAFPILQFQESVRRKEEVQLGTGSFKNRSDARRLIRAWERTARPRQKTRQTGREFAAMMGGLGVARRG